MPIKIECYLALLKKYREKYPNAHFEVITSRSSTVLKPSRKLLVESGVMKSRDKKVKEDGKVRIIKGIKKPKIPFEKYAQKLIKELLDNEKAVKRMKYLLELSKEKDVYLVCYEKDPSQCHRSLVRDLIYSFDDKNLENSLIKHLNIDLQKIKEEINNNYINEIGKTK